jgi:hypothetical protein
MRQFYNWDDKIPIILERFNKSTEEIVIARPEESCEPAMLHNMGFMGSAYVYMCYRPWIGKLVE